jgi:isopenicillin N synthase-like dioxygenase
MCHHRVREGPKEEPMTVSTRAVPSTGHAATIPVIDFGPCFAGVPGALLSAAAQPRRALEHVGFFLIPFFLGPHIDTVIECLPTCQGPDNPRRFAPITYEACLTWWYDANCNAAARDDARPA